MLLIRGLSWLLRWWAGRIVWSPYPAIAVPTLLGVVLAWSVSGDWVAALVVGLIGFAALYLRQSLLSGWFDLIRTRQIIESNLLDFYQQERRISRRYLRVRRTKIAGNYQVDFRVPAGETDERLMKQIPMVGNALGCVRWSPLDEDARMGYVTVIFCQTDPLLADLDNANAPILKLSDAETADPYSWVPLGIDELGRELTEPLFLEKAGSVRRIISGASGTGKSSKEKQRCLFAARNPHIDLVITDGKGSELGAFEPYSVSYSGLDITDFWEQLRFVETEAARRASVLAANKAGNPNRLTDTWNHIDDGNYLYWSFDEPFPIRARMKKTTGWYEFQTRFAGIASIARNLGIGISFTSQSFRGDILETTTRDNFFDIGEGYQHLSLQESEYLGFSSREEVRPDLIKGVLLPDGSMSSAGQFAVRGLGKATYGKSYYLSNTQIVSALKNTPIVNPKFRTPADTAVEGDTVLVSQ